MTRHDSYQTKIRSPHLPRGSITNMANPSTSYGISQQYTICIHNSYDNLYHNKRKKNYKIGKNMYMKQIMHCNTIACHDITKSTTLPQNKKGNI